ncbi:hypothetical protein [Streptomyces johnsoniae]|uniref:Uncharacterized protein n=1 Tax=Streptomyces johnsoniae TaxID=3075532 RepID=A0ABU2SAR3_9ACTN|nr:hypothetical protein [Streptomyces sp. DSM 41886]MDT0446067.1 hypothetical protein [Streptomyces sp. DSM 41886]
MPPSVRRLELTAARDAGRSSGPAEVNARWSFVSQAPGQNGDQGILPLPTLRIDGAFDLENRAPAGEPFSLRLGLDGWQGNASAPVADLALQASFDDGETWQPLAVTADGDGHVAEVVHPPGDGFVSLRASVTTEDGTALDQTVIRGYEIAAR